MAAPSLLPIDRVAARVEPTRARGSPADPDARLVAAARAPAPLRRALARVAGRMVAMRGWERLGFARLGDYAAERAGISARELRDLARVDAALGELPALEAAFAAGVIGWTQLRLVCRVATPASEAEWLARASTLTARALAREVRALDARARAPLPSADCDDEPRVGVRLRVTRRTQGRWWSARQRASRVAGHSLSHSAFAEVLAAEVLSGVPLEGEEGASGPAADERARRAGRARAGDPPTRPWRPPPGLAPSGSPEIAELERDLDAADAFELDRRLRRAVRLEARGLARVARGLAEVAAAGLHRELGYRGLDAYAEDRLGMCASRARALLRIERAARSCPPLRAAFASGGLSWVQAHALVPLLLEPGAARHRSAWIAHAQRVSVRRLGDDVAAALASGAFAAPPLAAPADPAGLQTGADPRNAKEGACLAFSAPAEVAQLFRALLATVQRRLERIRGRPCRTSDALEAMLDHALAAWRPEKPEPRAHAVFARDGWRCTAPGCTSHRNLQQHHVVFRSQGGSDDPSNLTTLCAWHHLRGVHGRVVRCTGTAPAGLRFELGLRDGAPPLAVYRSGDVIPSSARFARM